MPYLQRLKPKKPLNKPSNWPSLWFKDKAQKHVVIKMQLDALSLSKSPSPLPPLEHKVLAELEKKFSLKSSEADLTALLSDELLLQISSKLSDSQLNPNSLVCKRWLNLQRPLVHYVKLLDWDFLISGRFLSRFPNLTHVDLVAACIDTPRSSGILLTHKFLSVHLDSNFSPEFVPEKNLLPSALIDQGLRVLSQGCPNLWKLVLNATTDSGLSSVAEECPTLQELELHRCTDISLRGNFPQRMSG